MKVNKIIEEINNDSISYYYKNDYVSILRKYRQDYLFSAFNKEYSQSNKSIFILDKILPKLISWDSDYKTLVFWDEFKAHNVEKDWRGFNSCSLFCFRKENKKSLLRRPK